MKEHENLISSSKVVAKISICHAAQWERPFCLYFPACNNLLLARWFLLLHVSLGLFGPPSCCGQPNMVTDMSVTTVNNTVWLTN